MDLTRRQGRTGGLARGGARWGLAIALTGLAVATAAPEQPAGTGVTAGVGPRTAAPAADLSTAPTNGTAAVSAATSTNAAETLFRSSSEDGTDTNTTVITSDRLDFNYRRNFARFEGNVVVTDARMKIHSDSLLVRFQKEGQLESASAHGNVRIHMDDRDATCQTAVYVVSDAEVVLTGNACLYRQGDSLVGEKITFWLDKDTVKCEKGRLVVGPRSMATVTNTAPAGAGTGKTVADE